MLWTKKGSDPSSNFARNVLGSFDSPNSHLFQGGDGPLTGVVDGSILITSYSMKYKHKRTNKMYVLYECVHRRCKTGLSAKCARSMCLYPNRTCVPVGPEEHTSDYCYSNSGVKPPVNLVTKVSTVIHIKVKMGDMADKLTQEYKEGRLVRDIWREVKKIQDSYIASGTPYIGLNETEMKSRITQV